MSTEPGAQKSAFESILDDVEALTKALPAGDEGGSEDDGKIQAAADEADAEKDDDDKDKDGLVKSFEVTGPDGEKIQAVDGEALIKSFTDRLAKNETDTAKALEAVVGLCKSLADKVTTLSNRAVPRRTALTISEKPAPKAEEQLAKAQEGGLGAAEFLLKAEAVFNAGNLRGVELSTIEAHINRGEQPPADLVRRVLAG